jgi:hypothetical protein
VGSAIMAHAWQVCQTKEPAQLRWGEVGPHLLAAAVIQYALEAYAKPHTVFCPLGYEAWSQVLEPQAVWAFDGTTHAIHLWNEMWRRSQRDKNQRYHPACLYEQLKETYLRS